MYPLSDGNVGEAAPADKGPHFMAAIEQQPTPSGTDDWSGYGGDGWHEEAYCDDYYGGGKGGKDGRR